MVDFNLMGKLAHQESTVAALFGLRVHRRVLVVTKDQEDVERLHFNLILKLKEKMECKVHRPVRTSWRITSIDSVCRMDIISTKQLPSTKGQLFDLVWFRYLNGTEPFQLVQSVVMSCREGYGPLILWGNVMPDIEEAFNVRHT